MDYNRILFKLLDEGKVLCMLCVKKKQGYTKDGLRQHCAAYHQDVRWQKVWLDSLQDTVNLVRTENRDLIHHISQQNEDDGLPFYKVKVRGEQHELSAHSAKDACRMILVQLDCPLLPFKEVLINY